MVTRGVWKLQSDAWEMRKSLIREAFLPVDYVQFLLKPLQHSQQRVRLVEEYMEEFHQLIAHNDLNELE